MSRNYTKHYEKYGDDDFNIYEGEPEEEIGTMHRDAYFANGGEGFLQGTWDQDHIDAITDDIFDMYDRKDEAEQQKLQALKHSENLDKELSEEEYQHFIHKQYREIIYNRFCRVIQEFQNYIPDMLDAKKKYFEDLGIPMSSKLMALEQKKLFYF